MPILAFAVLALVIVLSVHVCRSGRSKMWLAVIWILPVLGSLIYVFVEMLPSLFSADSAPMRMARREGSLEDQVDREIDRRLQRMTMDQDSEQGTVHNRLQLAEACLVRGRFDEAIDLFAATRQGFFTDAPDILYGLARAHFGRGDWGEAVKLLDELSLGKPSYQPHGVAILKAQALAKLGNVTAALAILDAVLAQNENLEGRRLEAQYRYAEILWQNGETQKAATALTEILRHEQLFRVGDDERRWIRLAGQALQAIS